MNTPLDLDKYQGENLQKIRYAACGCELIGKAPLPVECPTHSKHACTDRQTVHVAMILDESGSMESCRSQTISGFNEYVKTLKEDSESDYLLSLVKFDLGAGPICRDVFIKQPIKSVTPLASSSYTPRGSTPMYDAIGQTVNRLDDTGVTKVIVVIMTDGEENASTEFNKDSVKKLIAQKEALGNWTFVYLGANQDAWGEATKIGIPVGNAINYNTQHMGATMAYMATNTVAYAGDQTLRSSNLFAGAKHVPLTPSELGKSGGAKRAAQLTPEERQELAKKAAQARWSKR